MGGPPFRVKANAMRAETPLKTLLTNPSGPKTCRYRVVSFTLPDHFTLRPYHFTSRPDLPLYRDWFKRAPRASLRARAARRPSSPAHQAGVVGFGPDAVLLLEGGHDATALLFRCSRVEDSEPLLEVDARTFVVLVVWKGVGHCLNQLEGHHVAGLVQRRSGGRVHGPHRLTGG